MKKILLFAAALVALVSCGQGKKSAEPASDKALILYYSQTSTTKTVADIIAKNIPSADVAEIKVTEPYGDYNQTIIRGQQEVNSGELPELEPLSVDLKDYGTIFLGYPVWFGTVANPILSLIKDEKFEGKNVVVFCTFGSGGLNTSMADLKKALPKANIVAGYGVRQARVASAPAELDRFLKELGCIEGEVEALPEYSETVDATPEQIAIFNEAISTYPMLAGTVASKVSCRKTLAGTDYIFTAGSARADGSMQESKIYVTVADAEGSVPEFTQVVR